MIIGKAKERGHNLVRLQHLEELIRIGRIRAIVERKRHHLPFLFRNTKRRACQTEQQVTQ